MKQLTRIAAATSVIALLGASSAFAQAALVGVESLDDRIDDIQEDVQDEFAKSADAQRYSTNQYAQGWSGSLSGSLSAASGNTDTVDVSVGSRLRYGDGPWNHTFGLAIEYGEDNDNTTEKNAFATYDVNRYFTDQFYVFGLGSVKYDDFATNKYDAFLGAGPGFRVINTPDMTWRVQAGPGMRYTEDQNGEDNTEFAGIASSRFFYRVNETVFLTNDTDAIHSKGSTLLTNEFGVNMKLTNTLTTRVGYRTEYDSDPLPGFKNTDNKLTAAVVMSF